MKEAFFLEGTMASKYMFATMFCFYLFSLFLPHKESNDTAETSSCMLKTTGEYLSFEIMIC